MKKRQKIITAIVVAIIMIIIIVVAIIIIPNKHKTKVQETAKEISNNTTSKQEFVRILEDGMQLNTSERLHETKTLEGMEISDFQLTEKDNVTLLLGTVTNISNTTQGGYPVNIKVMDRQGNEMITVAAFLGTLEPGKSTQLSTSATFRYANAYDFSVTRRYE